MKRRGWKPAVPWVQWPPLGVMTVADVTRVLKCSASYVRELVAAGELVGVETGPWSGQWVFRRVDVEAFQKVHGGGVVRPRAMTATGQLGIPIKAAKIRRPKPQPWSALRFRMAKATLADPQVNQAGKSRGKRHVA